MKEANSLRFALTVLAGSPARTMEAEWEIGLPPCAPGLHHG
eukprot:gene5246-19561_t